jgi:hypothetical protein
MTQWCLKLFRRKKLGESWFQVSLDIKVHDTPFQQKKKHAPVIPVPAGSRI